MIYVWWLDGEKITRTVIISQAGVYIPRRLPHSPPTDRDG